MFSKRSFYFVVALILLLLSILGTWEWISSTHSNIKFLFGQPSEVLSILISRILNGMAMADVWATVKPLIIGILLGNIVGTIMGIALAEVKDTQKVVAPLLSFVSGIPIFVFAPVLIVWFGTGIMMQAFVVFLSVLFLAAKQSFEGAFMIQNTFSHILIRVSEKRLQRIRHLTLPAALSWIAAGARASVSAGLFGVFIAEFISSERGVAHRAIRDASLFNVSAVWSSMILIAVISGIAYAFVTFGLRAIPHHKATTLG